MARPHVRTDGGSQTHMAARRRSGRSELESATILFDPTGIREPTRPSEDEERLVWMLLTLVRTREVSYATHARRFHRHVRTFQRDVAKLQALGVEYGFSLTKRPRGIATLAKIEGIAHPQTLVGSSEDAVRAVAEALGDVVAQSLQGVVALAGSAQDRFLHIATPRLRAQTAVAIRYGRLREAWRAGGRVRFRYPSRDGGRPRERVVEPHRVTFFAGRYYLIGFDVRPRVGWRQFALDRIVDPISLAGTFVRRIVPEVYRGEDALGLFKTGRTHEIVVELSPLIAEAVIAREWRRGQRVRQCGDGSALITFEVSDLGEGVRWSFGFGPQARVVAPPAAVDLACSQLVAMARATGADATSGSDRDRALSVEMS